MALTAPRDTPSYMPGSTKKAYPMKGSTTIYAGGNVMLDSSGLAVPAATATGTTCVGKALTTVVNAGADSAVKIEVIEGVHRWDNSDTITEAHVGAVAYMVDDLSVSHDGTGKSAAGIIEEVDSVGVWVRESVALSGALS